MGNLLFCVNKWSFESKYFVCANIFNKLQNCFKIVQLLVLFILFRKQYFELEFIDLKTLSIIENKSFFFILEVAE